jgi:hypothetical protein
MARTNSEKKIFHQKNKKESFGVELFLFVVGLI